MHSLKVESTFQFSRQLMTIPKFAHLRNLDFHWSELLIKLHILTISSLHPIPPPRHRCLCLPFLLPLLFFTALFLSFFVLCGVVIETDLYLWLAEEKRCCSKGTGLEKIGMSHKWSFLAELVFLFVHVCPNNGGGGGGLGWFSRARKASPYIQFGQDRGDKNTIIIFKKCLSVR